MTPQVKQLLQELKLLNFEHIQKRLEALWDTPEVAQYFDQILFDHRGSRQGFPKEVYRLLIKLQQLSNYQPTWHNNWQPTKYK